MQQTTFPNDSHEATIQARSMAAGDSFRALYAQRNAYGDEVLEALEAYKHLRRQLPISMETGRHVGHAEAHPYTQDYRKV